MDSKLLDRLCAGEHAIWYFINKEYRPAFVALTSGPYGIHLQDSEDAFQQAVISFLELLDAGKLTLREERDVCNILFVIYIRCFIGLKRKRLRSKEVHDSFDNLGSPDDEDVLAYEIELDYHLDLVNSVLPLLNHAEKKLFKLLMQGIFDAATIAEKLKLSNVNTANRRKLRLFAKIRSLLTKKGK